MQTITLLLPDSTYQSVVSQARERGFNEAHYLSSFVIERIDSEKVTKGRNQKLELGSVKPESKPAVSLPDTVEQIFEIYKYMLGFGMEYGEAVRLVASNLNIEETTVRDKCTRRISFPHERITTEIFLKMLGTKGALRDYLCRRFPKCEAEIRHRFAD